MSSKSNFLVPVKAQQKFKNKEPSVFKVPTKTIGKIASKSVKNTYLEIDKGYEKLLSSVDALKDSLDEWEDSVEPYIVEMDMQKLIKILLTKYKKIDKNDIVNLLNQSKINTTLAISTKSEAQYTDNEVEYFGKQKSEDWRVQECVEHKAYSDDDVDEDDYCKTYKKVLNDSSDLEDWMVKECDYFNQQKGSADDDDYDYDYNNAYQTMLNNIKMESFNLDNIDLIDDIEAMEAEYLEAMSINTFEESKIFDNYEFKRGATLSEMESEAEKDDNLGIFKLKSLMAANSAEKDEDIDSDKTETVKDDVIEVIKESKNINEPVSKAEKDKKIVDAKMTKNLVTQTAASETVEVKDPEAFNQTKNVSIDVIKAEIAAYEADKNGDIEALMKKLKLLICSAEEK